MVQTGLYPSQTDRKQGHRTRLPLVFYCLFYCAGTRVCSLLSCANVNGVPSVTTSVCFCHNLKLAFMLLLNHIFLLFYHQDPRHLSPQLKNSRATVFFKNAAIVVREVLQQN